LGKGYFLQAFISTSLNNNDKAQAQCISAMEISQKTGDKITLARSASLLATLYRMKNNYLRAIDNFSTAAGIYEEFGYAVPAASVYSRIAEMFYHLGGNSYDVIEYNIKALRLWKTTSFKNQVALQHIAIANAYMDLNEDSMASANLAYALSIGKQINDTFIIASAMNKTGAFLLKKGKYTDALTAFNKALELYQYQRQLLNDEGIPTSYFNLGDLKKYWGDSAFKKGDKETANKKYTEALSNYLVALEGYKKSGNRASEIGCVNFHRVYTNPSWEPRCSR
jgi:tetratricopeptide (TPR) repeat protein